MLGVLFNTPKATAQLMHISEKAVEKLSNLRRATVEPIYPNAGNVKNATHMVANEPNTNENAGAIPLVGNAAVVKIALNTASGHTGNLMGSERWVGIERQNRFTHTSNVTRK